MACSRRLISGDHPALRHALHGHRHAWHPPGDHQRVFKMAPLQHHFELAGWAETTIVVRFWMIAAMFTALGLWIFYRGGAADLLGGVTHVR